MAYTDIDKPSDNFSATLYTGNATARTIATGHQSDWVWLKRRDGTAGHRIADSVRGATKLIYSDSNTSEQTDAKSITGFVSTGFTLGDDANGYDVNTNTNTMVAWSWKAGTSFTNDASATGIGTIDSTGSVNQDAGFSVVSWVGNATAGATIKHGLNTAPSMLILKKASASGTDWFVYHKSIGANYYLGLNQTYEKQDQILAWNDTAPTSSVFSVGSGGSSNGSGATMITYCFAEKQGYSKFGSYTGNGNADGTFVYTGFKPAFFICKRYNDAGYDWLMYDNKRQVSFNVVDDFLKPNLADAETTGNANQSLDFLSNGVKFRGNGASSNGSASYIYMAFAENPFVASNFNAATAR